jgi:sugar phosphate isomerase/epimerase
MVQVSEISIDLANHLVTRKGEEVKLSATEYKLLAYLAGNAGRVLTYNAILSNVWGISEMNQMEYLRVYILQLRRKLEARGLRAADIFLQTALDFTSVAPNHPDKAIRDAGRMFFLKTLEFAAECESRHVTALPGVYFPEESREDSLQRCYEELAWRCEQAQKCNLVFAVEAHLGSIASTPSEAMGLIQNTRGLTLSLDYTHFTKLGIPDREIEPLINHASHFHARGAAKDRLQTPVKESTIDYAGVVRAMKKANYPGYIGIEYTWNEWENCNRTDNLSETILLRELIIKAYQEN